jgi:hypothetical protein
MQQRLSGSPAAAYNRKQLHVTWCILLSDKNACCPSTISIAGRPQQHRLRVTKYNTQRKSTLDFGRPVQQCYASRADLVCSNLVEIKTLSVQLSTTPKGNVLTCFQHLLRNKSVQTAMATGTSVLHQTNYNIH